MITLTAEDVELVESIISNALCKFAPGTVAREGIGADSALYDPTSGTVGSIFADTAAFFEPDDGQTIVLPRIPATTLHPGDQYGPVGNERTVMIHTDCGYVVTYRHGPNDSPGAPPGERWILHPQPGTLAPGQTVVWNSGLKFTNDGPTEGDGLGGTVVGNEGALTQAQTKSGHQIALNDTTKTIATTTAGGMTGVYNDTEKTITHTPVAGTFSRVDGLLQKLTHQASPTTVQTIDAIAQQIKTQGASGVYTIVDGAGNTISHVVAASGIVALGALVGASGLKPAISTTDLTSMLGDSSTGVNIQRWVDLVFTMKALLAAMTTSGVPSLPALTDVVTEMSSIFGTTVPGFDSLPSWSSIPIPSGSQIVQILPS